MIEILISVIVFALIFPIPSPWNNLLQGLVGILMLLVVLEYAGIHIGHVVKL